jgi:hypothetical protein
MRTLSEYHQVTGTVGTYRCQDENYVCPSSREILGSNFYVRTYVVATNYVCR